MKTIGVILMSLLMSAQMVYAQNPHKMLRHLEGGGCALISKGNNYTLEKCNDTTYIVKKYNVEYYTLMDLTTFNSNLLTTKHGLSMSLYDDGSILTKGHYRKNKKQGEWIEHVNTRGSYKDGKKNGVWEVKNEEGRVICEEPYLDGKLHGTATYYDSTGVAIRQVIYQDSILISSTGDSVVHVDVMPRYPGCENKNISDEEKKECADKALLRYLYRNVKYPKKDRRNNIQGRAIIEFVIEKDGRITNINVKRGLSKTIRKSCEKLVRRMPRWRPGMRDGEPMRVHFKLPVVFKLEG